MLSETVTTLLFYLFAFLAILLALGVVTARRILRAAVFLAGVLVCTAAFYIFLDMEFLAGIQVLVYIGGIVVLLVFAIMLTSSVEFVEERPSLMRKILGVMGAGAFFAVTVAAFVHTKYGFKPDGVRPESEVAEIGRKLLSYKADGYVLPFELISLLLLAALIGGIVIARKKSAAGSPVQGEIHGKGS